MTAKEIQTEVIKTYIKPTLKQYGYKTSGQTWWKDKGEFFLVINLQNSQWNSKDDLCFCLNIGVALTQKIADKEKKKVTCFDIVTRLREDAYLSEGRKKMKESQGGWLGYRITDKTTPKHFITDFKVDFEENILEKLEELKTLKDCVAFYERFEIWGDQLKKQIAELGLTIT